MSTPNPRKRAAPGSAPLVPMQQPIPQPYTAPNLGGDQMVRWNGGDGVGGYVDPSANPGNPFELIQSQSQYPQNLATSPNSLTRRPINRALIPTNSNFDSSWGFMGDGTALVPQHPDENGPQDDNIEELEERAQKAKREAQGKRKQIPPFVQKLSSFLEEGKNEDLIRWSEKGDSFIVLDEDEFAKTLIPELFKHNNYASFVRQLNMYGFHKRVGLSDNSMRASERKNKSPSEYSNPYFRRGHPNLLWLINKPRSGGSSGKGKEQQSKSTEEAEHDEAGHDEAHSHAQGTPGAHAPKSLPAAGEGSMQRKDVAVIRDELKQVREQQRLISRTIAQLQQNNRDLYNQALMFQNQHDRHQNSINAILHFLANLFRKSLEEQGNSQSVGDILSSMLANQGQPTHQGNVVDLGDFFQNNSDPTSSLGATPHRKTRGLLPPIPDQGSTPSRSTRSPSMGRGQYHPASHQNREMGQVTELFDGGSNADTPPNLRQELENNPQEQMMRIINDHNATNSSGMDLPEAAEFVANAPNNLNQEQRNQLANFMRRQSSTPTAPGRTSATPNPPPTSTSPASTSQSKPAIPPSAGPAGAVGTAGIPGAAGDNNAAPSLSPIMRSPAMPPLSMNQISTNESELARLQELQQQQDARINELSDMLGPLSPSGRIPGIDETGGDAYFDPQNVDIDQYFDPNAFLDDSTFGATNNDFNVNFDAPENVFDTGQGPVGNKTVNDSTPSPAGTEEIQRDDFLTDGSPGQSKRRRMG